MPPYTKIDGGRFVYYRRTYKEYKKLRKASEPRWMMLKCYDDFINNKSGDFGDCIKAYTSSTGFNTTWNRQQRLALGADVISERFGNHDMKRKAGSDIASSERRSFLGHMSESISELYNHTPDEAAVLKSPLNKSD